MKIALIKKDFKSRGGGAERYAREVATRLAKLGNHIYVHSETFENSLEINGIFHIPVHKKFFRGFSATVRFHRTVQKMIDRGQYDVIYSISKTYPSDVFRVTESLHCEWMKIRYSGIQRLNPRHSQILRLEKQIFKPTNTKFVLCNSNMIKEQICSNFPYPPERIFVIRNGVDHEEFYPSSFTERCEIRRRLKLDEQNLVLLFAASDFRIKGLEFALRAIAILPEKLKKKLVFLILGSGNKDYFVKLAIELGILQNLRFEGSVSSMRDYYLASDILLHPTLYEPFANVCLEALACGLPVITTRTNGASELINEPENGYLVMMADRYGDIADKIEKYSLLSEGARQTMSIKALERSRGLSWDKHVEELIKVLKK